MSEDDKITSPPPAEPCEAMARALLAAMDPVLEQLSRAELHELLRSIEQKTLNPALAAPVPAGAPAGPRWQDDVIERHIVQPGASVLDLGCGGGDLLVRLRRTRGVRGQGIELDPESVMTCVERGVAVIQADLDRGLSGYGDASFDYVVLEQTLQTLHRPTRVLAEMLRVGRRGIVAFPNFGHWRKRLELALCGRRPCVSADGHPWHATPNIRPLSLQDLLDWTQSAGIRITDGYALSDARVRPLDLSKDNLYAEEVLVVIEQA